MEYIHAVMVYNSYTVFENVAYEKNNAVGVKFLIYLFLN